MAKQHNRLPAVWNDDARMTVLFSPFRDKSLNPSSWNQKMSFWSDLIISDCKACGDVFVDVQTLPCRFQRNGKIPACLDVVVDEMKRTGKLKRIADAEMSPTKQSTINRGWMAWGVDTFIKAPVSFGWNFMTKPNVLNTKLVVLDVLKSKCDEICELQCASMDCDITDSVTEYSQLWSKCSHLVNTEVDFSITLKELAREKRVVFYNNDTSLLVKFPPRSNSNSVADPVTDQDLQIYSLKKASQILLERIEKLGKDVDRLTVEAKMHKRKDMKQYALRSLRQRRRTQNRMKKLSGSLDMIDDILCRIQHAASDEMVLKALQAGSGALKTLTERTGIDEVHRTMDNLAEILDQQNEVEAELSMSRPGDTTYEDLEKELENLIGDQTQDDIFLPSPEGATVTSPRAFMMTSPEGATVTSPRAFMMTSLEGATVTSPRGVMMTSPEGATVTSPRGVMMTSLEGATVTSPRGVMMTSPRGSTVASPRGVMVTLPRDTNVASPRGVMMSSSGVSTITSPRSAFVTSPGCAYVASPGGARSPHIESRATSSGGSPMMAQTSDSDKDIADLLAELDFNSPWVNIDLPEEVNTSKTETDDIKFPEIPNFSPGSPEKSKNRRKTWTKSPPMEAAPL